MKFKIVEIEGSFEFNSENSKYQKLFESIQNGSTMEQKRIEEKLEKEIGVLNPDYEEGIKAFFVLKYKNWEEIAERAKMEAQKNGYPASDGETYETPTHKMKIKRGNDIGFDYVKRICDVTITKK